MNRRTFINTMAVGILAAPLAAEGQPAGKTARIGYLSPVTGYNPVEDAFERPLQELGWIKGRNIGIESRYSGGRQDTVAALAAGLVGLRVDVIVAWGPTALAVKRATSQIPVVFLSMFADAVDLGLVSNLARPGGNVTGVGVSGLEMDAKRLQLLKEAVPSLRRITLLVSSERTLSSERRRILTAAAKDLSLEIHETEVARPSELESAVRKEKSRGARRYTSRRVVSPSRSEETSPILLWQISYRPSMRSERALWQADSCPTPRV